MEPLSQKQLLQTILDYHQKTKHHFQRYASGPDGLDWKHQPEAFRTFKGCTELKLPLLKYATDVVYNDLYQPDKISSQALSIKNIAQFLELSLGLSAWKQYGENKWALRCNPSSGNLHPTESYIIVENCEGISTGVHHYVSRDHTLEQRCQFSNEVKLLPDNCFLIGLSSIHWREAWKYGERAFRYCQLDAGHAISSIRYAAATLGWQAQVLTSAGDAQIETILGISRDPDFNSAEREYPDVMLLITTHAEKSSAHFFSLKKVAETANKSQWYGQANILSSHHLDDWPIIAQATQASVKPETDESTWQAPVLPGLNMTADKSSDLAASTLIKQRRSAQEFDSSHFTNRSSDAEKTASRPLFTEKILYRMLDLTLPRHSIPPMDSMLWKPAIHLLLFVHHVEGIESGLYLLLRNDEVKSTFQTHLKQDYEWLKPQNCPAHLPLFRLISGDAREAAKTLSCHQEIARDGVISVGFLAEYESNLTHKPWVYRQLFWEAGMLGQILYLEAESAGLRGTGIGCYFDDGVHELIGLAEDDHTFQSLYHFTIGKALTDNRLQTLPPYAHLQRSNLVEE